MERTGPSGAAVRSTARSNLGSNSTTVAAYDDPPTTTWVALSPATTWALVTTRPWATTRPDPSCSLPQAAPRTLTVDRYAGAARARVAASSGVETDPVKGGVRVEKTWGKPCSLR